MYSLQSTANHLSSHSNLSTTHESVNTTTANHSHRDSSLDKDSSLGKLRLQIFPWLSLSLSLSLTVSVSIS